MKIERYINDVGEFRCFAIDKSSASRHGVVAALSKLPGVSFTLLPRFWHEAVFCEFIYKGYKFYIEEPYGDNTTFDLIAPEPDLPELKELATLLENSELIKSGDLAHTMFYSLIWLIRAGLVAGIIALLVSLLTI